MSGACRTIRGRRGHTRRRRAPPRRAAQRGSKSRPRPSFDSVSRPSRGGPDRGDPGRGRILGRGDRVAREAGPVEQDHLIPLAGQKDGRGGGAGRAGPCHDNVSAGRGRGHPVRSRGTRRPDAGRRRGLRPRRRGAPLHANPVGTVPRSEKTWTLGTPAPNSSGPEKSSSSGISTSSTC